MSGSFFIQKFDQPNRGREMLMEEQSRLSMSTLYEMFQRGQDLAGPEPFLGTRQKLGNASNSNSSSDNNSYNKTQPLVFGDYQWQTYDEIAELRTFVGSGIIEVLRKHGCTSDGPFQTIGMYSINRAEWIITDLALSAYSLVNVSLCMLYSGFFCILFYFILTI